MVGMRFGRYELLDKLGAGGMGEVYRARDHDLRRDVAVKFLPEPFGAIPDRLGRFAQEARAASSLNHPNIVAVYDTGQSGGSPYIVSELLQGETLRDRLATGALGARKAVDYGVQVCRGLAAAHEHGVVHRDLKPENLFLTADGQVKILDFGLAKQTGPAADKDELPRAETRTAATEAGRVMGTAGYMSPEQAQGERADARSDLFALGAILYEMLSGRRAFAGATPADTLAAVLRSDPPEIEADGVPPGLERVVRRCLEKDPGERFQSAHDLGLALETLSGPAPPTLRSKRRRWRVAVVLAALGVLAAAGTTWQAWSRRSERQPADPMQIVPFTADGGFKWAPRLSPDGERVVYNWNEPGQGSGDLYVKSLGQGSRPLRLTDNPFGGFGAVWSPDGREIAFVRAAETGSGIYTMPSLGGQERRLIDVAGPWQMPGDTSHVITLLSWSADGQWLALSEKPREDEPARIVRLSLTTLEKTPLTFPPAGTLGDLSPELSPDGQTLAFVRSASREFGGWDVWVQPVSRPEARQLTFGKYDYCSGLAWTADGKEVVFSTSHGFRPGRMLRVAVAGGAPAPLAGIGSDVAWPSVRAGRMVHEQLMPADYDIWRIPGRRSTVADRKPEKLIASRWSDAEASYSPDGRRIAFVSDRGGTSNVWVCDEDGGNPVQLTAAPSAGWAPWSPDGRRIVFNSWESGRPQIYVVDSEGGVPRRLTHEPSEKGAAVFSRDGRFIYFSSDRSGGSQIWRMPADGGPAVQVTRRGGFAAQESWDARYVYYSKASVGGGLWRVPVEGGEETPVLRAQPTDWTHWALSRSGIYWATYSARRWIGDYAIHFLDFQSGRTETLFRMRNRAVSIFLAVSPDDEWILYSEAPFPQSELMLVENFR